MADRNLRTMVVAAVLSAVAVAACTSNAEAPLPSAGTSSDSSTGSPSPAETTASPVPDVELRTPTLPEIETVKEAGGVAIEATHDADWTLVAYGRTWVAGIGRGVGSYDARSGRLLGSVSVPDVPCEAMDAGFGAVWTATCSPAGVSRIDPDRARVTGHVDLEIPDSESSIAAGEGAVWVITNGTSCNACVVARIDPRTVDVTDRFDVPDDATAVRAGLGAVWLTYAFEDAVLQMNPSTGEIVATIPVAGGPRFFDVGAGGVWVMAQQAGALCHIDARRARLVACSVIDPNGVDGGDLTVGAGFVWFRGSDELVAKVDPTTGEVVARIGPGQGSGSASGGAGQLWISAHDAATIYRVPLS